MRTLSAQNIIEPLSELIRSTLKKVDAHTCRAVLAAEQSETAPLCKWALGAILKNNAVAEQTGSFPCQDCGQAVLFVTLGQDLHMEGDLKTALQQGVANGYSDARKSVCDPLTRINTQTNAPAVIHYDIVPGETLEIAFLAKGAGAENMSRVFMLTPAEREKGIIDCVIQAVSDAGANPCPPIILGIGIGGTMETAAVLSKKALLRETGAPAPDARVHALEQKILSAVNRLGIGAQGFGGSITALSAAVETAPTHIGMLPVAVNLQCHSVRHGKIVL